MRLTLDDAAWSSPWRTRSTLEKSLLCLGLLLVAATTTSLVVAGLVGVCAVGLAAVARVPARVWCHAMAGPAVFIAIGINPESADRLAHLLEITVRVASRPERVLAGGVLTDRKLIEAYFGASRPKLGRLFHRTHRPLGAG